MARAEKQAKVAETGPTPGQFIANLSNGVTVELVGVCEHPSEGKQWWRPDGSRFMGDPYKTFNPRVYPDNTEQARELAIRLQGPQDVVNQTDVLWQIPDCTSSSGNIGDRDENGNQIMHTRAVSFKCDVNRQSLDFKVAIAAGPWKSVASAPPAGGTTNDSLNDRTVIFYPAYERDGLVVLSVAHLIDRVDSRIVAIDEAGQIHTARRSSSGKGDELTGSTYSFEMALNKIRSFQLQVRPYEWVAFNNVSLRSGVKTDVQIEVERPDVLRVPSAKYPTIPVAVEAATSGDTIILDASEQNKPDVNIKKPHQYAATLSDGVTVELVGVCDHPSEGKQWWRPDGTPIEIDELPDYDYDDAVTVKGNEHARLLVFRLDDTVVQGAGISWSLKDARESRFAPDYTDETRIKRRPVQVILAAFQKTLESTDLRLGVATGLWETVASGTPGRAGAHTLDSIVRADVIYHEAHEENGRVHISATHLLGPDYDSRIYAIGHNGEAFEPRHYSNSGREMRQCKSEFDISLEKVKFFYLQARPFQWVTFRDISLQPGLKTNVETETQNNLGVGTGENDRQPDVPVQKTKASPIGNYALGFDGINDFLEIHASESLKLGRSFTIQMWIKPEFPDTSTPESGRNLLSKGGYINAHPDKKGNRMARAYGFSLNLRPVESSRVALDMSTGNGGIYTSTIIFPYESGWLHLVIVSRENGGASRGINYIQTGEVPYQPAPNSNIIVGGDSLAPVGNPFRGQIAELRIWNRSLDSDEVEHYKTVSLSGNEPNLVGCWTFEQGQGQRVRDLSPYRNDASLGSSYSLEDSDPVWVRIGAEKQNDKALDTQIEGQKTDGQIKEESSQTKTVLLPDVDNKGLTLDLASGTLLEVPKGTPEQIRLAIEKLNKGDLVFDASSLILVRGAATPSLPGNTTEPFKRYEIGQKLPEILNIRTKEGMEWTIEIRSVDKQGCELQYYPVHPNHYVSSIPLTTLECKFIGQLLELVKQVEEKYPDQATHWPGGPQFYHVDAQGHVTVWCYQQLWRRSKDCEEDEVGFGSSRLVNATGMYYLPDGTLLQSRWRWRDRVGGMTDIRVKIGRAVGENERVALIHRHGLPNEYDLLARDGLEKKIMLDSFRKQPLSIIVRVDKPMRLKGYWGGDVQTDFQHYDEYDQLLMTGPPVDIDKPILITVELP